MVLVSATAFGPAGGWNVIVAVLGTAMAGCAVHVAIAGPQGVTVIVAFVAVAAAVHWITYWPVPTVTVPAVPAAIE
jgi:hypothetical protein